MVTFVGSSVHISAGNVFLVLDRATFADALTRGKAVRRAQAQRAREAIAASAAQDKRDTMTTGKDRP